MTKKRISSLLLALTVAVTQDVFAASPWVLEPGRQALSYSFVHETFDTVWIGETKNEVGFAERDVTQMTNWLNYEIGVVNRFQLGVTAGFVNSERTEVEPGDDFKEFSGLADTRISGKYLLLDEYAEAPLTASVMATAIIKGTYDRSGPGQPHGPGDKANGFELLLPLAKKAGPFQLSAEVGYRFRMDDVPDDFLFSAGVGLPFSNRFMGSVKYKVENGQDGTDIMGEGFDPNEFHKTKEQRSLIDVGGYLLINRYLSAFGGYSQVLDGRNTGESKIIYLGIEFTR